MNLAFTSTAQIGFRQILIALGLLIVSNAPTHADEPVQPVGAPVEITAKVVACPIAGVTCIRLSAVNLSNSQSLIVQGTKATLTSSSRSVTAESQRSVYKMLGKKNLDKKRELQLAASVATAGLGTMLVSDAIDRRRGKQEWLGDEAKRRQQSDTLFAERIVLPLDHTDGLLYFVVASSASRLRISTKQWPPEEGPPSDACEYVEVSVQSAQ